MAACGRAYTTAAARLAPRRRAAPRGGPRAAAAAAVGGGEGEAQEEEEPARPPFSLGRAILFAGMAFDVYTDPRPHQAIWEMDVPAAATARPEDGACALGYMSPRLLARCRRGVLEVRVDSVELAGGGLMRLLRSSPSCYLRVTCAGRGGRCVSNRTTVAGGLLRGGARWADERMYFYLDEGQIVPAAEGGGGNAVELGVSVRAPLPLSTASPLLTARDLLHAEDASGESDAYSALAEGTVRVRLRGGGARAEELPLEGAAARGARLSARVRYLPVPAGADPAALFDASPMGLTAARPLELEGAVDATVAKIVRSVSLASLGDDRAVSLEEIGALVAGTASLVERLVGELDLGARADGELLSMCRARGLALRTPSAAAAGFDFSHGSAGNRAAASAMLTSALTYDLEVARRRLLERAVEHAARNYNSVVPWGAGAAPVDGRSVRRGVSDLLGGLRRLASGRTNGDVLLEAVSEALSTAAELAAAGGGGGNADAALRAMRSATARAVAAYTIKLSSHRAGRALTSVGKGSAWEALVSANNLVHGGVEDAAVDPLAYERLVFVDSLLTDTQCCVWREASPRAPAAAGGGGRRRLVVVFRGTESAKWKDILTDLQIEPRPPRLHPDDEEERDMRVHAGFADAYVSVRARLLRALRDARAAEGADGGDVWWEVCATGHSLGGALATLFAYDLSKSPEAGGIASIACHTFGSPPVGNAAFARGFGAAVDESCRFFNKKDVVATAPPPAAYGYQHVRGGVLLCSESSTMTVGRESRYMEAEAGGEARVELPMGIGALAAVPPIAGSVSMSALQQTLSELVSGDGVAQHMEDYYFDVISSVLLRVNKNDAGALVVSAGE